MRSGETCVFYDPSFTVLVNLSRFIRNIYNCIYLFDFVCPSRFVMTAIQVKWFPLPFQLTWPTDAHGLDDFWRTFRFETTVNAKNVCGVGRAISESMCIPGNHHCPFTRCPVWSFEIWTIHAKCRTSKLVSSVPVAHRARWHGGTYAKPTLLGGDGTEIRGPESEIT